MADEKANQEIGADWEEAFQATEYAEGPPDEAAGEPAAAEEPAAAPAGRRLASLPRPSYLVAGGALLALLLAALLFWLFFPSSPPSPPPATQRSGATPEVPAPAAPEPTPEALPPAPPPADVTPGEAAPAAQQAAGQVVELPPPAPVLERRKIRLADFLVAVADPDSGAPQYLAVDLSLVLHLSPEEEFPADQRIVLRDLVYQFFANRPLYELKRYRLARGEMKANLLAWLHRQWTAIPIDTVVFHQYRLL